MLHHLKPEEHEEAQLTDLHDRDGINLWLAGNCSKSTSTFCGEFVVSQVRYSKLVEIDLNHR